MNLTQLNSLLPILQVMIHQPEQLTPEKNCVYLSFSDGQWDYKYSRYIEQKYTPNSKWALFTNNYTGRQILELDLKTLTIDHLLSDEQYLEIEKILITWRRDQKIDTILNLT